jgi:hypothetical protein
MQVWNSTYQHLNVRYKKVFQNIVETVVNKTGDHLKK